MRIIHFLNHAQDANGHVNVAVDLACEQAQRGHDVWLMAGDNDYEETLAANGVGYVRLPHRTGGRRALGILGLAAVPKLVAFTTASLLKLRPDVVHSHMAFSALVAWLVGRPLRIPLVTTVHNSFDRQSILMCLADRVVCVSDAVRIKMQGRGGSKRQLRVVHNGTSGSARLSPRAPVAVALSSPAIVCIAGLHPRKGVADLIRAAELLLLEHPTVCLYIVGSGPCEAELKAQALETSAPERIVFLGYLADPRGVLEAADIFALASLADPFPLVVLEAMAAGCAVVATAVDGIPEALDGGRAGILVPPADPSALYRALSELLRSPSKLSELRAAARHRGAQFSVARMASDYETVYRELAAQRQ